VALPARYRFTVDDYYRMAEAGVLAPDDRVELIDGEVVEMAPIGSRHAACVDQITRLFVTGAGDRAVVRVQNPVRLSPYSEPEPDLVLARPRPNGYAAAHPAPVDVLLLVEVADTTVAFDRGRKLQLYAGAGIPEVWLIDLPAATVEVYREPDGARYLRWSTAVAGDHVSPAAVPDLTLAVSDLLP
jgi:Uma2 family endonuclease